MANILRHPACDGIPVMPRSRFGWLGKLNGALYYVGLCVVWIVKVDGNGRAYGKSKYRLWRRSTFLQKCKEAF